MAMEDSSATQPALIHRTKSAAEREEIVLDYIIYFKRENDGTSPTVREIQHALKISSTSLVNYYLRNLKLAGRIRFCGNGSARGIMVVGGCWQMEAGNK
jgi:SOS-response transcriptional repressor LexA